MWIRDWALAAVGAVAVVTVYESRGYVRGTDEPSGREVAQARRPEQPALERVLDTTEMPLTGSSGAKARAAAVTPSERDISSQLAAVNDRLAAVQREKRELEAQLRSVQDELAQSTDVEAAADEFDLDREDWKRLAAEGRIKYRVPCTIPPDYNLSQERLDKLGLTPEDGKSLTDAHHRSNARLWAALRPLCLKSIADPGVVERLGTMACLRIIEDQATASDRFAIVAAQRQVAEVHAGLRPQPAAGESPSPLFDAYLAFTSEGQFFEADLAQSFGPEEGHRIASSMICMATLR